MSSGKSFVHLHNHSQFSLLDGASRLDELCQQAARFDMPAVAVTDHGNLFGAIPFFEAAAAAGVKPILGCESYIAPGHRTERTPGGPGRKPYYHLLLLARNEQGYRNLMRLSTAGFLEGYYYRPRIDRELLADERRRPDCDVDLPGRRDSAAHPQRAGGSGRAGRCRVPGDFRRREFLLRVAGPGHPGRGDGQRSADPDGTAPEDSVPRHQ